MWRKNPKATAMWVKVFAAVILLMAATTWIFNYRLLFSGQAVANSEDLLWYHIDFHVYQLGAEAMLRGENIYTQDYAVADIMLPFTYPPLAAMLFAPLSLVPTNLGAAILTVINVALLWHCITLVLRAATKLKSGKTIGGVPLTVVSLGLTVVLMWCEPVRSTMGFGQVNIILMWLVLLDTLGKRRFVPSGTLVGLAAAIKLTPAVFGLYFLVRRQWAKAATAVVSGVGFSGLAWLISPENSSQYWLHTLHDPSRIGGLSAESNQSWNGWLYRNATLAAQGADAQIQEPANWVWLLGAVAFGLLVVAAMIILKRKQAYVAMVFANATVALVCSPVSWSHHWVWFAPLMAYLLVLAWVHLQQAKPLGSVLIGLVGITAALAFTGPHWLRSELVFYREAYVLYSVILLCAVAGWDLWPRGWRVAGAPDADVKSARAVMWFLLALGVGLLAGWAVLKV